MNYVIKTDFFIPITMSEICGSVNNLSIDNDEKFDTLMLKSSEGRLFCVGKKTIYQSSVIKNMYEDIEGSEPDIRIPLTTIDSETLERILIYCDHHKHDEPTDEPLPKFEYMSDWDKEYINLPYDTLVKLVIAANFLDIKALLDLCCKAIADSIKDKSTEEIRKLFKMDEIVEDDEEPKNIESI